MSYDMKAKCRIDVEKLGLGLKNEIELETDNDLSQFAFSLPEVYALRVGRITCDSKASFFKLDKENDNTKLLDIVLKEGNYVEIPTTTFEDELGTFEYGADIYVPYDVLNHPAKCEDVLIDYEACTECDDIYFEATFHVEGYTKKIYFKKNEHGKLRLYDFFYILNEYIDYAAEQKIAGLKLTTDGWIEAEFYNDAGISNNLSFEDSFDFFKQVSSIRMVRFNPKECK